MKPELRIDSQRMRLAFDQLAAIGATVDAASHSAREFTEWSDCVNGANTLLQTALRLAGGGGSDPASH